MVECIYGSRRAANTVPAKSKATSLVTFTRNVMKLLVRDFGCHTAEAIMQAPQQCANELVGILLVVTLAYWHGSLDTMRGDWGT